MQKINTVQILKEAWVKTRANFWIITNAILLVVLVLFATNLFSQYVEARGPVLNFIAFILTAVVESFMMFVLMKLFLDIYYNKETTVLGVFKETNGFYKFFILYTAINLATFAGVLLFIIPAFYVILTYSFALYIFLDQKTSINESLAKSAIITKGHKMELLKFWTWIVTINIFGGALFLLGLVVTLSVTFFSVIEVYKKLSTAEII